MTNGTNEAPTLSADPQLRAIELAQAHSNARKAAAEADKAVTDAQTAATAAAFPTPTSKPVEGKVDLGEKVGLVADLVAHAMVQRAAGRIVDALGEALDEKHSRFLLVDAPDLVGSDWVFSLVQRQIDDAKTELQAILDSLPIPEAPGKPQPEALGAAMALPLITGAVGSVADLVSMFRSDYALQAREVTIGAVPLSAALAHHLLPQVAEVNLDKFSLLEDSDLFKAFDEANGMRLELQRKAAQLKESVVSPADRKAERAKDARAAYVNALVSDHQPDPTRLQALEQEAKQLEGEVATEADAAQRARAAVAVGEAAVVRFDALAKALTSAEGGYPPLVGAALRERLHEGNHRYTHVLYATVESAGGETLTRRGAFRSSIRFMGGAQVSYMLWNVRKKRLVAAGTLPVLGQVHGDLKGGLSGPVNEVDLDA